MFKKKIACFSKNIFVPPRSRRWASSVQWSAPPWPYTRCPTPLGWGPSRGCGPSIALLWGSLWHPWASSGAPLLWRQLGILLVCRIFKRFLVLNIYIFFCMLVNGMQFFNYLLFGTLLVRMIFQHFFYLKYIGCPTKMCLIFVWIIPPVQIEMFWVCLFHVIEVLLFFYYMYTLFYN